MNLNLELLEKDINYGLTKEKEIEKTIKHYFKMDWFEKLSMFHPMDYEGKSLGFGRFKYYFEIKSRRFKHDKYKTTMIGKNKIDYANKYPYDNYYFFYYYFVFVFEDGIYYYEYNIEDKLKSSIGGRTDRGVDEVKQYYYIPIKKLIKIEFYG